MLASAVFRELVNLHADIWRQVLDRRLGISLWIQPMGWSIKLKTCVLLLAFEFISLTIMLFNRESFLSCVYFHYYSWSVNCSKWMAQYAYYWLIHCGEEFYLLISNWQFIFTIFLSTRTCSFILSNKTLCLKIHCAKFN